MSLIVVGEWLAPAGSTCSKKYLSRRKDWIMSARLVWIATCEVCETTSEFDGSLSVEELGEAARAAGWELPVYGGMFCQRCAYAVKALSRRKG